MNKKRNEKRTIMKKVTNRRCDFMYRIKRKVKRSPQKKRLISIARHGFNQIMSENENGILNVFQVLIESNTNNDSSDSDSDSNDNMFEIKKVEEIQKKESKKFESFARVLFNKENDEDECDMNLHEDLQCIICKTRKKKVVYYPCKHFMYCITCTKKWIIDDVNGTIKKKVTCPECRKQIESIDRLYL